jgi:hypothetical protein
MLEKLDGGGTLTREATKTMREIISSKNDLANYPTEVPFRVDTIDMISLRDRNWKSMMGLMVGTKMTIKTLSTFEIVKSQQRTRGILSLHSLEWRFVDLSGFCVVGSRVGGCLLLWPQFRFLLSDPESLTRGSPSENQREEKETGRRYEWTEDAAQDIQGYSGGMHRSIPDYPPPAYDERYRQSRHEVEHRHHGFDEEFRHHRRPKKRGPPIRARKYVKALGWLAGT